MKIKAFIVNTNEEGYVAEIDNVLESYQKLVDGYIQICYLEDGILAVINEEGLIKDLPVNLWIDRYGWIRGDVVFVRDDGKGDFESLTEQDIENLRNFY